MLHKKYTKWSILFFFLGSLQLLLVGVLNIITLHIFNGLFALVVGVLVGLWWSGFPYGWAEMSKLREKFAPILVLPVVGWICYLVVKCLLAVLTGWYYMLKSPRIS